MSDIDERSPLFRSWGGWYTLLIVFLLLQIVLFFLITKYYS
jgi:hypothetical protein